MAGFHPFLWMFQLWQYILDKLLSPDPPPAAENLKRPRIAVIGAGLTGVAAAAHCVGHGFEVVIFEAGSRKNLGGIWTHVNSTSGLQVHSMMYRFFPSVFWKKDYPSRDEILGQVSEVWKRYNLESCTKFDTKVTSARPDRNERWTINNDTSLGKFDGIIAAVGTCGEPKIVKLPGQEKFKGEIYHSSELDGKNVRGKNVLIVGGGASAIEAVQYAAASGAAKAKVLARSEKWIIPRNPIIDMLLSFNIFGEEIWLSWLPERLLKKFFYRELADIAPPIDKGIYTDTPTLNTEILDQIRAGKVEWLRGDIIGFEENGIMFNHRSKGVPKNGPGKKALEEGQVTILATGYQRPSLDFLPEECFEDPYMPPNWYLQCFPPQHLSVCAENCTYVNAIGVVGNFHIGIYTRILLMFLLDPLTRPSEYWMKFWVDMTRFIKMRSPTGAFDFFTYSELIWWFCFCIAINPLRWKWALFVFFGIGIGLPMSIVDRERELREGWDIPDSKIHTY